MKDSKKLCSLSQLALGATLAFLPTGSAFAIDTSIHSAPSVSIESALQQQSIKGTVTNDSGEAIIGANVIVKGTTNGTITDMDGNFTLNISGPCVLQISYMGFKTQEVKVTPNSKGITVKLKEDSELLNEVVVVGYGTQKKVNLTGSVASVDFKEQAKSRPVTNVSNALAGMSAGVQVMQGSGRPGSDGSSIRVRGIGTLNSSEPLVLIDGMEGSIDAVNPQDIESISVLKDAASSAIYGSRAAAGVILITTKKGTAGKLNVSYTGRFSYAQPTNLIKQVTDYADYMEYINESFENIGQNKHFSQSTIDLWREKSQDPNGLNENGVPNYIAYPNTDWQKVLFTHGIIHDHNISVNGGTENLRVLMSVGYLDNPGLVENTGVKKYSLRANIEAKINKWMTVGTRTYASREDIDPGQFDNANNYLRQTTPGVYPRLNDQYGFPEAPEESATANGILVFLNKVNGETQKSRFNTTLFSTISPIKGLSWDFNFNYKQYQYESRSWSNPFDLVKFSTGEIAVPATSPSKLSTSFSNSSNYSYTIENILKYNTTINKDHDLGALAGYQEFYYRSNSSSASKEGLIDPSIHTIGKANEMKSIGGSAGDRASRSFFGRVNYAYKSRYLLEANLRYDGHSRYEQDRRWGLFPSFSAGWRVSEESFMESTKNWLDNLKLRASYGSLGNNGGTDVGDYESQATYDVHSYPFGGILSSGLAISALANPYLEWETSHMTNFGIDLAALQNRLTFTFDAFYKKTTGILFRPSIPLTVGNKTAPRKNIAEMSTKGIELTLGWQDKIGEVRYSVTGNFSYTPNKIDYYKGELEKTWVEDDKGNKYWTYSNLGEVSSSTSAVNPIIQGNIKNEYFLKSPYKGSGLGFDVDGINGGPADGMIRTETDMAWVKAMIANGYTFRPNGTVAKNKIWYGDYVYADANGDGVYGGDDDREFQNVSSDPKFTFGMQMAASWKNFDISMNWAGQAGFKLYWGPATGYNSPTTRIGCAIGKDITDNHYFYDPENPNDPRTNINGKYGRLVASESGYQNTASSTLYLFNGNYLKLKNLTLGYTFPTQLLQKAYISNLRVYASIENVFSIDKFPGQDPELGASPKYTSVRQFALGVNLSF